LLVPVRAVLICLPLILCGCGRPLALVFLEPAFWDAAGGGEVLKKGLERAAHGEGWKARIVLAENGKGGPSQQLEALLSKERIPTVVLGPFLSFEGMRLANSFPATRFLLIDGYAGEDTAANTTQLQFDRRDAFREAGIASALSAADGTAGPVGKVGILRMIPAGAGDFEGDAFRDGAEGISGSGTVVIRELPESADRSRARLLLEEMREAGVELFLLRAGNLAPFLLDSLRETGGTAVVEDWASSRMLPRQVFLSIEEDVPAAVGLCLSRNAAGRSVVYGPVRIMAGEARTLPAPLRERVDHVGR